MGKVTGFKEFDRKTEDYRPVELRIKDYGEIFTGTHDVAQSTRARRKMYGLRRAVLPIRKRLSS